MSPQKDDRARLRVSSQAHPPVPSPSIFVGDEELTPATHPSLGVGFQMSRYLDAVSKQLEQMAITIQLSAKTTEDLWDGYSDAKARLDAIDLWKEGYLPRREHEVTNFTREIADLRVCVDSIKARISPIERDMAAREAAAVERERQMKNTTNTISILQGIATVVGFIITYFLARH